MCSFILLIFSSKSFSIFLVSILKYLNVNSNMWLIHRSASIDTFSLDFELYFPPSYHWSYDSVSFGLVRLSSFDFAISLWAALSPKAQSFCSFSARCQLLYQFPYLAKLALKTTLQLLKWNLCSVLEFFWCYLLPDFLGHYCVCTIFKPIKRFGAPFSLAPCFLRFPPSICSCFGIELWLLFLHLS